MRPPMILRIPSGRAASFVCRNSLRLARPEFRRGRPRASRSKMQIQPARVFLPSKSNPSRTKQNQAKLLGFVWFYSSESGLFNELRRIQIRNFCPASRSRSGCGRKSQPTRSPHSRLRGRWLSAAFLVAEHHSAVFCSWQDKVINSGITPVPRAHPALDRPPFRKN